LINVRYRFEVDVVEQKSLLKILSTVLLQMEKDKRMRSKANQDKTDHNKKHPEKFKE